MDVDHLYSAWRGIKMLFRFGGQVSAEAMHIHLGLIGFFILYALFRKTSRPAIYALMVLLVLTVLNECADIFFDLRNIGTIKEWNSIKDFVATLFWPSIATAYILYSNNKSGQGSP